MQALLPGLHEAISPARQSGKLGIASACWRSYEVHATFEHAGDHDAGEGYVIL
jgi:hypothetical protein